MDQARRITYGVLSVSFILLSVGVFSARSSPATGYELSIYTQTPVVYWIALGVGLCVTTYSLLSERWPKPVGIALGAVSIASLLLLPIIRGYYHVGATDAISHWGTSREILQTGAVVGWRYPAIHVTTAIWTLLTGGDSNTMLYLLAAVYGLAFSGFVFVAVRRLKNGTPNAKYIAFVASLLFLPVNHLGARIKAHPTSQAVLFVPVILFVVFLYYDDLRKRSSILLVLLTFFYIYLHPQQAANLVLMLGLMSVSMVALERNASSDYFDSLYERHFPTLIAGLLFWVVMSSRTVFVDKLQNTVARFLQLSARGAASVEGRASSVDAVGGSILEIFLKLFLVATLFCGLYCLNLVIMGWRARNRTQKISTIELTLSVGIVSIILMVGFFLAGGISDQFARHLSFIMAVVTVLGSLGLTKLYAVTESKLGPRVTRSAAMVFFVCCLLLAVPIVHPSGYIYRGSDHVPESHVSGYDTAIEYYDADQPIIYARSPAYRYARATLSGDEITGTLEEYHQNGTGAAPIHFANQSIHRAPQLQYIGVVEADVARDADLYNGFKFSYSDFRYVESHPAINKVVTNGEFRFYHAPGDPFADVPGSPAANSSTPESGPG